MIFNLTKHLKVNKNEGGVDYLVGDVHGHYNELMAALKTVNFGKEDRLFFLGDICNRGQDSIKCIELLISKEMTVFMVEGNHDRMIVELANSYEVQQTLKDDRVGGQWALDCYENEPTRFKFLSSILYANSYNAITLETERGIIGLMHAQAPDDWAVFESNNSIDDKILIDGLWSRSKYNSDDNELQPIKNIALTVHGHANSSNIVVKHNMIWIDTLLVGKGLTIISTDQAFDLIS